MRVSIQTSDIRLLREALKSECGGVRFGSEFCEQLLPSSHTLERAYEFSCENGKEFTYVTPRLSNAGIAKLKEQFPLLNEKGEIADHSSPSVVVNDFGALNILHRYPNLHPHLGRNLFLVPARSAWAEGHLRDEEPSSENQAQRRIRDPHSSTSLVAALDAASISHMGDWVRDLYSTTSLNYHATIKLYQSYGCEKVDVDWIPRILPALGFLIEKGLSLSVHLYLVPVTFTRKCHTARFLGEKSPETCSRPCLRRAFMLRNEALQEYGVDFLLGGNTVFRLVQPSPGDVADLEKAGVAEFVVTMSPITRIDTSEKIDDFILAQCSALPSS